MRARKDLLVAGVALAIGAGVGHATWRYFSRHLTREARVDDIARGKVAEGQAVFVHDPEILVGKVLRVPDLDKRDPKGQKAYRYAAVGDPATGRKMVVLLWRTTFMGARNDGVKMVAELRGTVRRTPFAEKERVLAELGSQLESSSDADFYLDEMEFDAVAPGAALAAVVAFGLLGLGALSGLRGLRPAGPSAAAAAPLVTVGARSAAPAARPGTALGNPAAAGRRLPAQEKIWTCEACNTESPIASKTCSLCKAPVEVEYYVAGNLPVEGFDRFVPLLTRVLQVSEYQATQPLARVHTPLPYQHLDSFHAKGPGSSAPYRLAARGIQSLVAARALAADLKEKSVEGVVVGSDELKRGPFPRKANGLRYDEDGVTFVFEMGPDREERTIAWGRVSLIVFSAAMPLRGTMTIAREMREGAPVDPSAYLVDLYERGNPDGVRIAAHSFHRWDFIKTGGSERPADRFGKLLEILETHASGADIQYVTGAYRGPRSEWRMNFYSRFSYLVGDRAGWSKQEGPPRLEGYEVLEKVGEGGMGSVYRARQRKLGRIVALKVIATHLAAQERFVSRFQAEARAVANLSHPNIVQVIDLAESGGRHFMVMEFVEGQSLLKVVKARTRLGEEEGLTIGLQIARALSHAWEHGIVHRDVKPDNVFIDAKGLSKLGDWGLAKDMEQDLGLTDTGTAIGTPYYMSPEQARGRKDLDIRSDLYSLGATLYHVLVGKPPFRGGSPGEVIAKHLTAPIPDPCLENPELTPETGRVLRRMLGKRPEDRYADGRSAIAALEHALAAARSRELASV